MEASVVASCARDHRLHLEEAVVLATAVSLSGGAGEAVGDGGHDNDAHRVSNHIDGRRWAWSDAMSVGLTSSERYLRTLAGLVGTIKQSEQFLQSLAVCSNNLNQLALKGHNPQSVAKVPELRRLCRDAATDRNDMRAYLCDMSTSPKKVADPAERASQHREAPLGKPVCLCSNRDNRPLASSGSPSDTGTDACLRRVEKKLPSSLTKVLHTLSEWSVDAVRAECTPVDGRMLFGNLRLALWTALGRRGTCPICLKTFIHDAVRLAVSLPCSECHVFHLECLIKWL